MSKKPDVLLAGKSNSLKENIVKYSNFQKQAWLWLILPDSRTHFFWRKLSSDGKYWYDIYNNKCVSSKFFHSNQVLPNDQVQRKFHAREDYYENKTKKRWRLSSCQKRTQEFTWKVEKSQVPFFFLISGKKIIEKHHLCHTNEPARGINTRSSSFLKLFLFISQGGKKLENQVSLKNKWKSKLKDVEYWNQEDKHSFAVITLICMCVHTHIYTYTHTITIVSYVISLYI